jgi:myo-inositol-1-phosphate synthase
VSTINIGLVGIGNCAASLLQGVEYYSKNPNAAGLTNPVCAGYAVSAVRVTSAFDVHAGKINKDLSEAIWVSPNNALKFADVPRLGVLVHDGVLSDGISSYCAGHIDKAGHSTLENIATHLAATHTDVLVNFLPTGSQRASEIYAEAAIRARCAFVNCMPALIARSADWVRRFEEARLPLLGDDLKSQFGATLVHHALMDTLTRNGVRLRDTYQIVSGGNMDFLNLQDPERVKSKKASKVHGFGGAELPSESVHFGAEYIPFLRDRKTAFVRIDGEAFGGTPIEVELKMSVEDLPSAAGNVLDAVRYMKAALDRGDAGVIRPVAALLMKAPLAPMSETDARHALSIWMQKDVPTTG